MFFKDLDAGEIKKVESISIERTYSKGDFLLQEGMVGQSFFLIISGHVQVRKGMRGGKTRKLVELGPGDLVGEAGFLGIEQRLAHVVALTDCQALEFGRERFEKLIMDYPRIGLKAFRGMAKGLAYRLAKTNENLVDMIVWAAGKVDPTQMPDIDFAVPHLSRLSVKPRKNTEEKN